ncbi:MAG TPA: M48 family metalloprotease [bacterium]|nr:M48 family metalloprotease [bacterium]
MFYALPAETVFEARERTRRATFYLFILLVFLYVFFANLMALAAYCFIRITHHVPLHEELFPLYDIGLVAANATFGAVMLAVLHFFMVRGKSLDDMIDQIKARPADEKDSYHRVFLNLVEEAEAATGIHGIRAVVLVTPGCNAFSLQDGAGRCAIGATEGLLSKLDRAELSAVVAHEAAHLVHEDSRLVATACFLFAIFGKIYEVLGAGMRAATYSTYDRRSSSRGGNISGVFVVLWLISGVGYFITRLISMAISREREYLADADGVSMCKDPFAMAEGLDKISRRFRGDMPDTYSALFILNPNQLGMDEQEGFFSNLFSNHPPVSKRVSKLLDWAKSDLIALREAEDTEEKAVRTQATPAAAPLGSGFMAYENNQWAGPYSPNQLLAMGFMTPTTWVCPAGSQEVSRAADTPELLPLFQQQVKGSVAPEACPRCKVPLVKTRYEGAEVEQCSFCKGYLLRAGVLERMIIRDEVNFSPEDIRKAKVWRDSQRGTLPERDHFPDIKCPYCQSPMCKGIHSMLTQVVIDHCSNYSCMAIWCDGGELESIQMLIHDAHSDPWAKSPIS